MRSSKVQEIYDLLAFLEIHHKQLLAPDGARYKLAPLHHCAEVLRVCFGLRHHFEVIRYAIRIGNRAGYDKRATQIRPEATVHSLLGLYYRSKLGQMNAPVTNVPQPYRHEHFLGMRTKNKVHAVLAKRRPTPNKHPRLRLMLLD